MLLLLQVQHSFGFTIVQEQPESRRTEQGQCVLRWLVALSSHLVWGAEQHWHLVPWLVFWTAWGYVSDTATLQAAYMPTSFVCAILSNVTNPSTTKAIHSGSWVQAEGIFMATLDRLHSHYNQLLLFCFIPDDGLCTFK